MKTCPRCRTEKALDAFYLRHVTGRARGLLCHSCNRAIGLMKDNPSALRKAADYIEGTRE